MVVVMSLRVQIRECRWYYRSPSSSRQGPKVLGWLVAGPKRKSHIATGDKLRQARPGPPIAKLTPTTWTLVSRNSLVGGILGILGRLF